MTEESIRALARRFLKKNNLYSFPVDLRKAALITGAMVFYEKLPKISGFVLEGDHPDFPYIIGINSQKPYFHRRFTIAHELGHIFLNHIKKAKILCEKQNILKDETPFEREANIFASELLVPTDKLKQIMHYNFSINKLSDFFQVSREVIKYRLSSIDYLSLHHQESSILFLSHLAL